MRIILLLKANYCFVWWQETWTFPILKPDIPLVLSLELIPKKYRSMLQLLDAWDTLCVLAHSPVWMMLELLPKFRGKKKHCCNTGIMLTSSGHKLKADTGSLALSSGQHLPCPAAFIHGHCSPIPEVMSNVIVTVPWTSQCPFLNIARPRCVKVMCWEGKWKQTQRCGSKCTTLKWSCRKWETNIHVKARSTWEESGTGSFSVLPNKPEMRSSCNKIKKTFKTFSKCVIYLFIAHY